MTGKALGAAVLASFLAVTPQAWGRASAPLIPTALVEDVKSASADVEFMDYVGTGKVIKLEPGETLVLSYLRSCEHETISGGTVHIGANRSEVEGGHVTRAKGPCNGGNMTLVSAQANASGASSFRLQQAPVELTTYALPPVIEIPKLRSGDSRTLVIERLNRPSERLTIEIDESLAKGGLYDLGKADARLQPGARYTAVLGSHKLFFKVHGRATTGKAPIVSKLLRFPAS
jgi:hypothetical protein